MQLDQLSAIRSSLTRMRAHSAELSRIELPMLANGRLDATPAHALVQRAHTDAELAVDLLQRVGVEREAVDAAKLAAGMLDHASLDPIALRHLGMRLETFASRIEAVPSYQAATAIADAGPLLEQPATSIKPAQWQQLLLALDDTDLAATFPSTFDDAPSVRETFASIAGGSTDAVQTAQRYMDARSMMLRSDPERAALIETILAKPNASLAAADLRTLRSLVDAGVSDAYAAVREPLPGADPFETVIRRAAAGDADALPPTARYLDAWRLGGTSARAQLDRALELVSRPAASLSTAQWRQLDALLTTGPDGVRALAPATLAANKPFTAVVADLARRAYPAGWRTERYFELIRLGRMDAPARLEAATTLLSKAPSTLTSAEWGRVSAMLEHAPTRSLIDIPAQLSGSKSLRTIVFDLAEGSYKPGPTTARFFEAFRIGRMSEAERLDAASALFSRQPSELTSADWIRVSALIEHAPTRAMLQLPDALPGSKPFSTIAAELAAGAYRPGPFTARYFEAFRIGRTSEAERLDAASALFSRQPSELTSAEWLQLAALLDHAPTRALIDIPAQLPGSKPLRTIAMELAKGDYLPGVRTEAYFHAWRTRNDPTFRARVDAALAEVVAGAPSAEARTLVAGEWHRLAQVVAGRPPAEQAAIALAMLGSDSVAGSRSVKSTLELLRTNLADQHDVPSELATLHAETLTLIDRNVARLSGTTPRGAVRGYSNHPDYAEIGRIRANLTLLDEVRAQQQLGVHTGPDAAGEAASATAPAATPGGETLTW